MSLFRGLRVLYCAAIFAGTAAIMFLTPESPAWLHPVLIVLWVLLVFAAFEGIAFARLKRANDLLDNCRCRDYIDYWERMLPRARRTNAFTVKLNLSAGYLEMGRPQRARELLDSLPPIPEKPRYASYRLVNDNNRVVCSRMLDRLDEADAQLSLYRTHLAAVSPKLAKRSRIDTLCETQAVLQRMARGDFDGAIPYFEGRLRDAPALRGRVAAHYDLAWALHHEGRIDEARDHLAWAAANGGDTWYATAAKRKLEAL